MHTLRTCQGCKIVSSWIFSHPNKHTLILLLLLKENTEEKEIVINCYCLLAMTIKQMFHGDHLKLAWHGTLTYQSVYYDRYS